MGGETAYLVHTLPQDQLSSPQLSYGSTYKGGASQVVGKVLWYLSFVSFLLPFLSLPTLYFIQIYKKTNEQKNSPLGNGECYKPSLRSSAIPRGKNKNKRLGGTLHMLPCRQGQVQAPGRYRKGSSFMCTEALRQHLSTSSSPPDFCLYLKD